MGWLWDLLHAPTMFQLGHTAVFVLYPLVPWVAVMAAGYCFGPVMRMEEDRRRRLLFRLGIGLIAGFFVLRLANVYGDPGRWAGQASTVLTVISFFRG